MFCEKCGKEIIENSALCSECMQNENNAEPSENETAIDNVTESVVNEPVETPKDEVVEESSDFEEEKLPKRMKEKKKRRVIAHIGATLLLILFAFLLIATTCLMVVRDAASPDTIKEMINNIDLNDIKIDDLADKEILEEHGLICNSDNLFDIIYDNIDQSELPYPISKEDFRAIIENEQFREYFGEIFGVSIEMLTSGDSSDVVTSDDIVEYLASNREEFSLILGYDLTDERLENLKQTLDNDYGKVFEAIGNKKLDSLMGEDVANAINFIFADWLFVVLILSDIIVCGLVFLVLRSVSSSVKYCSITMIVIGVIFLCASIAVLNGLLSVLVGGPLMYVLNQLISVVLWETIVISIVLIVIGICAPIAVEIISRYKKRHVI